MKSFFERAHELNENLVRDRRYLHENAELGTELPVTTAYVMERLKEIGLEPVEICSSAVTAVIDSQKPGKTLLLRADMDALPMSEDNTLSFRTHTDAAHTCGHDLHAAMLLCAAQMLNERKNDFCGKVKLMFQPAEEIFAGASLMIENGILKNPDVDAAMAMHVALDTEPGTISYGSGYITSSCDGFKLTITGKGCHGAMPHTGIDPINVGVHIYQAFQELVARETPPLETAALTFGQFTAGSSTNIIPETAIMQGTLRTYNKELRAHLVERMKETSDLIGRAFGAKVEYTTYSAVPPTYVDPDMLEEMLGYIRGMKAGLKESSGYITTPSEDFAFIAEQVPSIYIMNNAKTDGNPYAQHNPGVIFNEDALPIGASIYAECAFNWLNNHAQTI